MKQSQILFLTLSFVFFSHLAMADNPSAVPATSQLRPNAGILLQNNTKVENAVDAPMQVNPKIEKILPVKSVDFTRTRPDKTVFHCLDINLGPLNGAITYSLNICSYGENLQNATLDACAKMAVTAMANPNLVFRFLAKFDSSGGYLPQNWTQNRGSMLLDGATPNQLTCSVFAAPEGSEGQVAN